jgi:hypothetical protein
VAGSVAGPEWQARPLNELQEARGYWRMTTTGISDEQLVKFWEPFRPMAPERFAERALRAVSRGDAIIVVPAWWKAFWYHVGA